MTTTAEMPKWQLDSLFPGLDSREYGRARAGLESELAALEALMDERGVRTGGTDEGAGALLDALLERLVRVSTAYADLNAYLVGFTSTDAFDDRARAERSSLQPAANRLSTLIKRFTAWLGGLDLDAVAASSQRAGAYRYPLERARRNARHLLGDEAEAVVSALNPSAGGAWAKLHGDLISRETIAADLPGLEPGRGYNVAELKNLQGSDDPTLRQAAYRAELELLRRNEVAFAAAMNSIKGQVGELDRRRGWSSPLEQSIHDSAITPGALAAMQQACRESFPSFRRYLVAKARFLGKERLGWYDLLAPVAVGAPRRFDWDETKTFVVENFRTYSDRLADFAERTFASGWVDVPPRRGKTNGAFCMSAPGRGESRVLLNFGGRLDDVFTVAHELGHAYHNDCMYRAGRDVLQKQTPMTLAETASIFCETIVVNALLEGADDVARLAVLEQDLLSSTQLVLDIHSRFLFEKGVFDRRRERELSPSELDALMLDAQHAAYGEALAADERHPLMWAHKGHYYSPSRSFYNYPYTFGFLFGLGLYDRYRTQPDGFVERYDDLLASTGMADAATLARGFGIDIEDPAFWRGSLRVAETRVEAYEALIERFTP